MHYRIDFDAIPWETPMAGVRHKLHRVGNQVLRLVEYSRDMPPHWCEKGHAGHIVSGTFEIEFKTHREVFEQGDALFIPSGDAHAHRAVARTATVTALFVEDV